MASSDARPVARAPSDDEKYLWKGDIEKGQTLDKFYKLGKENARDIIACGNVCARECAFFASYLLIGMANFLVAGQRYPDAGRKEKREGGVQAVVSGSRVWFPGFVWSSSRRLVSVGGCGGGE